MVEHSLTNDPKLQNRLRTRYSGEIAALEQLGFQVLGFAVEKDSPFSAILQLPALVLMALNREVLTFPSPVRLGVATVLLKSLDSSTVALCMGKGLKLYTRFGDETILITSTFRSYLLPKAGSKLIKLAAGPSIEAAWSAHAQEATRLAALSQGLRPVGTYAEFLEVVRGEEDASQYE